MKSSTLSEKHKKAMKEAAIAARAHSYAPYSNYPVSCALLCEGEKILSGVNVENASYPCCLCAEAQVVGHAVSLGIRKIHAAYIITPNGATPCGKCRQILSEFADRDMIVITSDQNGEEKSFTLGELLPTEFKG